MLNKRKHLIFTDACVLFSTKRSRKKENACSIAIEHPAHCFFDRRGNSIRPMLGK